MKASKMQDKLLLLKLKKKDPEAFAQAYDFYVNAIYRFIYFKVPRHQDAEDLTAEVFLKTWQFITQSDEAIRNLQALLYRLARNTVVDFYRNRKVQLVEDEELLVKIEDVRQQNFLAEIDAKAELKNLEPILRRIKDEYREVLVLRYIEELSISEIASSLEKSKGSVRVLLHRALKVVRELTKTDDNNNASDARPAVD